MIKLKPCPFCGGEASIERYGTTKISTQYSCNFCGCFLETGETFNHGLRWNERFSKKSLKCLDKRMLIDYIYKIINLWRKK